MSVNVVTAIEMEHWKWNPYEGLSQYNTKRTESDLFSLVRRENEREKSEQRDDGARDDEVEAVVDAETSDVDDERDVNVRIRTAVVHLLMPVRGHLCTNTMSCQARRIIGQS